MQTIISLLFQIEILMALVYVLDSLYFWSCCISLMIPLKKKNFSKIHISLAYNLQKCICEALNESIREKETEKGRVSSGTKNKN